MVPEEPARCVSKYLWNAFVNLVQNHMFITGFTGSFEYFAKAFFLKLLR